MKYKDIRKKYIDFMISKGHAEIINASLVPENDPTILFTPAGMSPIVPYLLGEKHPQGTRLTNAQRCIRTIDIDEVGDNTHLTLFEMAGNWSLNDYFKKEAISWTFEFLTKELDFEAKDLYASVFSGDEDAPRDDESIDVWKKLFADQGIEADAGGADKRIQLFDKSECWWEIPTGGPCGPCSEIFLDTGKERCGNNCNVSCDCGKYVEIGNNVFMEFLKEDGKYKPLGKHNVDFGGGLARWAMLLQGVDSVFDMDIYKPIYEKVQSLAVQDNSPDKGGNSEGTEELERSLRIVTEHITAASFILMDGVAPSNTEQGYILRRLIRRAIRHARQLGIPTPFAKEVAQVVIDQWKEFYPELEEKKNFIFEELEKEETKFEKTVEKGEKELIKLFENTYFFTSEDSDRKVYFEESELGKALFNVYETYGFPFELSLELLTEYANKYKIEIDLGVITDEFNKAFQSHQEKSRAGAKDKFVGGLADASEMSTKYHTATHLLNAALKEIVGKHVFQKGSNITPERLRFDFPNPSKLTPEQVEDVENWVNDKIEKALQVTWEEMNPEQAQELGAEGIFTHRYGDVVKVYTIGDKKSPISRELCGGPHVTNTSELGKFKIVKQENVGAGIKRIKAVLE